MHRLLWLPLTLLLLSPRAARAGCCALRKLDAELPTLALRVCEKNALGECGALLFQGPLALGALANVCTAQTRILYQEDLGSGLGAPVEAACDGADVEL